MVRHSIADLNTVRSHAEKGRELVLRQEQVVRTLSGRGQPCELAETLLATMEQTLRFYEYELRELAAELGVSLSEMQDSPDRIGLKLSERTDTQSQHLVFVCRNSECLRKFVVD